MKATRNRKGCQYLLKACDFTLKLRLCCCDLIGSMDLHVLESLGGAIGKVGHVSARVCVLRLDLKERKFSQRYYRQHKMRQYYGNVV